MLELLLAAHLASSASAADLKVLVTDKYGNPAGDAVVYLVEETPGSYPAPESPYVMDQIKQEFVPRVLPILAGGKVSFPNQDNIHHQIYSFSDAKKFELPLYKGKPSDPITFDRPGIVKVGCNIHDWMAGVIVILPNPVFAKTDAKGKAQLKLPDGAKSVLLEVFHDRLRAEPATTRKTVAVGADASARGGPTGPGPAVEWKLPLKLDNRKKRPTSHSAY